MHPEAAFQLASTTALLAWVLLLASPPSASWAPLARRVAGRVVPLLLSAGYGLLLALHWRGQGGFGSLAEVQALFAEPGVLVAGWVHYLAFDLFVGAWIAERGAALGLPHGWLVPVLLLTFLLGPLGLLAFGLLRAWRQPQPMGMWLRGKA